MNSTMKTLLLSLLLIVALITQPIVTSSVIDDNKNESSRIGFAEQQREPNYSLYGNLEENTSEPISSSQIHRQQYGDTFNELTKENNVFIGISQFERFLATEKASLMSSSSYYANDLDIIIQTGNNENQETLKNCSFNINQVIDAARMRRSWALEMIDANGKPTSGVLKGDTRFVGDFDQCMDVDTGLAFEGQYCTVSMMISVIQNTTVSPPISFQLGVCFPSTCEPEDVQSHINYYLDNNPDVRITAVNTRCQKRHLHLSTKAKFVICVCSIFAALVAAGTFYDVFYKRWWLTSERQQNIISGDGDGHITNGAPPSVPKAANSERKPIIDSTAQKRKSYSNTESTTPERSPTYDVCDKVLMAFSLYSNTSKLFTVHQTQDSIGCIHGMRFLSLTWIILVHTFSSCGEAGENISPYLDNSYADLTFMAVVKASIAVDTFFSMSGLLLNYVILKKLTKERVTPRFIATFYLHRFWRLTPPYMLILMTYVPLIKYISSGPFWPQDGFEIDECKDTWWTNLLYMNNFIRIDKACMRWTWYLACDMQFYIVSPLLFLPMFFYGLKGFVVPFAFLLGTAICSGVITNAKDILSVSGFDVIRGPFPGYFEFVKYYYLKPYNRIGSFVIGMITGFLLWKLECKIKMPKVAVVLGWMAATAIALAVVYGFYDHVNPDDMLSKDVRALYNALHRIAWGISVCWVIFACATGYGGFVNTLLSWKVFVPLSRLSYCAYLIQTPVIRHFFLSQRTLIYVNNFNLAHTFVTNVVLVYAVAYIAYMAYEIPFTGLEKIISAFGKKK